jgi:putative DNA primase/helicase
VWQDTKALDLMSPNERAKMLEERQKQKEIAELEAKKAHDQGMILAGERYKNALTMEGDNISYFLRKSVSNFKGKLDDKQALIVPIRDLFTGAFLNVQAVVEGLDFKPLQKGVQVSRFSNYGLIINSFDLSDIWTLDTIPPKARVFVCEGIATACTVFDVMRLPTVCTFGSGNIERTARAIIERGFDVVVSADNDTTKQSNGGLIKAGNASKATGASLVVASGINGTDFNDDFVNALKIDQNRGEALKTIRQAIEGQLVTELNTNAPKISVMSGLDGMPQLYAVCDSIVSETMASKLVKKTFLEPKSEMLAMKATTKYTTLNIKGSEIKSPIIWLAFGSDQAWLNKAQQLGMIPLNDSDLANTANNQGLKAVSGGITELLQIALSGTGLKVPTVTNAPIFTDTTRKGKPLNTLENWQDLMQWEGVGLRYNVMTRDVEFRSSWDTGRYGQADTRKNSDLAKLVSRSLKHDLNGGHLVPSYVLTLASEQSYHPVKDWIDRKEWDGIDRFNALLASIVTDKSKIYDTIKAKLLAKWCIGAYQAIALDKPNAQHGVIVLQGAQGIGKTRWINKLCPIVGAVKDGLRLDTKNTDSIRLATRQWITELGELDGTFKKSEIAELKAFLTSDTDSYRMPYHISMEDYPRRTAFIASVNEQQYLIDDTGNRRFWTIPLEGVNHDHDIDMQQLWAQIKHLYEKGAVWYLTKEELEELNSLNNSFKASNPYEDAIISHFYCDQVEKPNNSLSAGQVAEACGYIAPNKATANAFAKACRALGFESKRRSVNGTDTNYFIMPQVRSR